MEPDVIIATFAMIGLACVGRSLTGSWLSPSPLFALIWSFIVVLSLSAPVFNAPLYPVWAGALWWIDLQILMLTIGDLIGQGGLRRSPEPRAPLPELAPVAGLPYSGFIVIFCTACTLVWMLMLDQIEGRGEQPPTPMQIILAFHYAGGIFGGLIFAAAKTRRFKIFGLLGIPPAIFFSIFLAGRTAVVAQFTFWFAGYCSMRAFLSAKRVHLFTRGKLSGAVLSMTLFAIIGILVEPFRAVPRGVDPVERFQRYVEVIDPNSINDSWEFMKPGFFGHIAAFSWYFERAWDSPPPLSHPGEQTFAGIYRLLGFELTPALYTRVGGVDTNVFTIFKPIIDDYTLGGSVVVFLLIGIAAGWSYRQLVEGRQLWPAAFLVMFYNNTLISGGWYFNYNSVTGAHLLVLIYLYWFQSTRRAGAAVPRPWLADLLGHERANPGPLIPAAASVGGRRDN